MIRLDIIISLGCLLSFMMYHYLLLHEKIEEAMTSATLTHYHDIDMYNIEREDILMKNKQSALMLIEEIDNRLKIVLEIMKVLNQF